MDWIDTVYQERERGINRGFDQSQHAAVNARYPGCTLEYCFLCDAPTGRAGAGDDSIFDDDGEGPYCEECYKEHPEKFRDE